MESNAASDTRRTHPRLNQRVSLPFLEPPPLAPVPSLGEKLSRLERLASVGVMAAGVAHEIKNAMVAIRTFVDLLLANNKDAELAEIVKREMLRIDGMVSQMLRFATNQKPQRTELQINQVLEHSLRLIEPPLALKGIRLKRALRARRCKVIADTHQLEQVFANLFLNAIEAMGHDGQLSVATSLTQSPAGASSTSSRPAVEITIRDTGAGIAKEHLPRVFEPFFTTRPDGTGLGLAITREIIEQLQGKISVESEPKKGTSFRIILPLA